MPILERDHERPMFRFSTGTTKPSARVTCLWCGWKATGNDPRIVYPKADEHVCKRAR
jgi:hypothetical protein